MADYIDNGLIPNTTYFYKITAFNANGISLFSDTLEVKSGNNTPQLEEIGTIVAKETVPKQVPLVVSDPDFKSLDNYKIVVLGSSTAEGTGASRRTKSWVGLLTTWVQNSFSNVQVDNLAKGGFTTYDIRPDGSSPAPNVNKNISEAIRRSPDLILINMPSNNVANDIPVATTMEHYHEILGLARQNGIPVLLTTTQPRNFSDIDTNKRHLLETEANAVRADFRNLVIDIYDELTDFNNDNRIKAHYNSGDGIHVNDYGHAYIFNTVKEKIISYLPLETFTFTLNNNPLFIQVQSQDVFGNAQLSINPIIGNQGLYNNLSLKVSDNNGGENTISFNVDVKDNNYVFAPTGLSLNSNTHYSSSISWTDNSENETNFEIFRSKNDLSNFVKVGEVAADVNNFETYPWNQIVSIFIECWQKTPVKIQDFPMI